MKEFFHTTFKIVIFLFLSNFTTTTFGQTFFNYQNDFQTILAKTKDQNDSLFYNGLLTRFLANDNTMTDFEVLALLIGFTDKAEYKPYQDIKKEREIYKLNGQGKFKEALDSATLFLQNHPLSQQAIIEISHSYFKLDNKERADYYMYQFQRIMKAMDFSGDGKEVPFFALGPADGQNYIRKYLATEVGTMGSGRDINGDFLDRLGAKISDGDQVVLSFIIQHAVNKMFSSELHKPDEKKSKRKRK